MTTKPGQEENATGEVSATELPPELAALLTSLQEFAPDRSGAAGTLAVAAYRRAAADALRRVSEDPATPARWLVGALDFLDGRAPGSLALRVFNPTLTDHGWEAGGTVVEANVEDSPFLVSTVIEELGQLGLEPVEVLHPVVGVVRDDRGGVVEIVPARRSASRESFIHIELVERLPETRTEETAARLRRVLTDARAATRDFPAMRERVSHVIRVTQAQAGARYSPEEIREACDLLAWLLDQHFIFLGYREYEFVERDSSPMAAVRAGTGLGILEDESTSTYAEPVPLDAVPPSLRARMTGGDLLLVARTNRSSTVHRQVRMIYVGIKMVDASGTIVGEYRFLGLFAQRAYGQPASSIPVLRRKLTQILDAEDVVDRSYDERSMRTLFEAFPKHELFTASVDELRESLVRLLQSQKHQNVRILTRVDPGQRGVSVLVAVPRERFNANLRQGIQSLLAERFSTRDVDYHLSLTERDQALLHFLLHVDPDAIEDAALDRLEQDITDLTRTWDDELGDALVEACGEGRGARLKRRWSKRFPPSYRAAVSPASAVRDVLVLDEVLGAGAHVHMSVEPSADEDNAAWRFKLFKLGAGVELSSFVPILESLGLIVVEEVPHQITLDGDEPDVVHIHDFGVRSDLQQPVDVERDGPRLAEAAQAIWDGLAEADSLNRLVVLAGLGWREVHVLRAYRRYQRQVGTAFTEAYQNEAFIQHPVVARALMDLFRARLDPEADGGDEPLARAREAMEAALENVERLDHDRILRRYLGMVEATVRTNRYAQVEERPGSALALKFDSAAVPGIPKPVPYREIFVYSPRVEGVHLRGGPVARGGIRWSDRLEDFRTEVLGLMKSQMIKNSVIVPTGAKGGFVLKRAPVDPRAERAAVRQRYETYIRALLDVTDNVREGQVVPPPGVRRRDGDDPYLVVAPDKGTAVFSDAANDIAGEYGFWLHDGFASGGSRGYDHKAMGITARGAWTAVQRHFRELDVDVQHEAITMVGIGDMSGDVFGNGLLQSRSVKLVAAFDHRDIFLDPDPDPEAGHRERQRLFEQPGSTWQDYDPHVLSDGGGVFSRTVKRIPLTPQVRTRLGMDADAVSPPELIQAILRAPVDLLFAAGVGTFVKASDETHADVGDRVNDAIRLDATELGARVVVEGGNLALTQRARIQYSRRGGRCNLDAIDNSAGVDTSDREVNLKILLSMAAERGQLDPAERAATLSAMTPDVAEGALRNVYLQTWIISEEGATSPGGLESYEQLMRDLESAIGGDNGRRMRLDREVEVLPASDQMRERREAGAGLTRPELAVLLGYTKVDLRDRLLKGRLVDQDAVAGALRTYFPAEAIKRFSDLVLKHPLRRELLATLLANSIVNRMGITYVSRTAHEFGCRLEQVLAGWWAAIKVASAEEYWRELEELDGRCDPALQLELKAEVDRLVDAFTRSYLRQDITDVEAFIARDRPMFEELAQTIGTLGSPERQRARRRRAVRFVDLGIDATLVERIIALGDLIFVPDVSTLARHSGHAVRHVADVFLRVSDALPLELLRRRLLETRPEGSWERWQQRGLLDDLRWTRRRVAGRVLAEHPDAEPAQAVEAYLAARATGRSRIEGLLGPFESEQEASLAPVAVVIRALRDALDLGEPDGAP